MRIRATKPEFWRSKTISALSWDIRLVLKGLESYVDDNGVGKDDIALIAADVFPRDLSASPRDTLARLTEAISMLHSADLIARYEVDGEDLLYIDKWRDIQRIDKPGKGRFPRPDGTFEYIEDVDRATYRTIRDTLARPPVTLAPVTGEQRNRGTEEQRNRGTDLSVMDISKPDLDALFEDAYSHWPKKVERKVALERFGAASKRMAPDDLAAHIIRFGDAYAATTEKRFTPALGVWIGHERWTDELPTAAQVERKPTRTDQNLDFVAQLAREEAQTQRGLTA